MELTKERIMELTKYRIQAHIPAHGTTRTELANNLGIEKYLLDAFVIRNPDFKVTHNCSSSDYHIKTAKRAMRPRLSKNPKRVEVELLTKIDCTVYRPGSNDHKGIGSLKIFTND